MQMQMMLVQTQKMSLTLGQEMRLGLVLTAPDDSTDSIFPEIVKWIHGGANRQIALTKITTQDSLSDYRSYMDYLVCQVFWEIKPFCFSFYAGDGYQLKETISVPGRDKMTAALWIACEIALMVFENETDFSWERIRQLAEMQPEWAQLSGIRLLA